MVVMKTMSSQVVQTHIIPSDDTIDADVIQVLNMTMVMIMVTQIMVTIVLGVSIINNQQLIINN